MEAEELTCRDCLYYRVCMERSREYPCTVFVKGGKQNDDRGTKRTVRPDPGDLAQV